MKERREGEGGDTGGGRLEGVGGLDEHHHVPVTGWSAGLGVESVELSRVESRGRAARQHGTAVCDAGVFK